MNFVICLSTLCSDFALSVLSFFVLSTKWRLCKTSWYLVLKNIFCMPTLPKNWCYLRIGEKDPLVLLQIEVVLLQNIKINNFYIHIKSWSIFDILQKQSFRGVLIKRCSEKMQQIYRRTPMPKCDFNKFAKLELDITSLPGTLWSILWIFGSE